MSLFCNYFSFSWWVSFLSFSSILLFMFESNKYQIMQFLFKYLIHIFSALFCLLVFVLICIRSFYDLISRNTHKTSLNTHFSMNCYYCFKNAIMNCENNYFFIVSALYFWFIFTFRNVFPSVPSLVYTLNCTVNAFCSFPNCNRTECLSVLKISIFQVAILVDKWIFREISFKNYLFKTMKLLPFYNLL